MVHPEKAIAVRRATAAEILPFVLEAGRYTAPGAAVDLGAIAENGASFIVYQDGAPIFGYTLEAIGREVLITAASGRAGRDLTRAGLMLVEAHAKGFDSIRFHTVRRGLVRKATRFGYAIADTINGVYIMRKNLK